MENQFKGTKGEWRVLKSYQNKHDVTVNEIGAANVKGLATINEPSNPDWEYEQGANTNLIITALELFNELNTIYLSFGGGNIITFREDDIERIGKVINKALGK